MTKHRRTIVFLLAVLFITTWMNQLVAQTKHPVIVLDAKNGSQLPKRFRSTLQLPSVTNINWDALSEIKMPASGQFAKEALAKII